MNRRVGEAHASSSERPRVGTALTRLSPPYDAQAARVMMRRVGEAHASSRDGPAWASPTLRCKRRKE